MGDAAAARRLLEGPDADPASGSVLEGLAQASYLQFDFLRCVEEWERAYAAHRRSGEHVGAVRVARTVACVHLMILGNGAVGSGWLSRAQTLLGDAPDSPEAGWVALDIGMFEGDRSRKSSASGRRSSGPEAPMTPISSSSRSPISGRPSCMPT